jgi:hypothetical protein
MPAQQAWIRRGTVRAPDDVYQFGVGRVTLPSGQISVSRVKMAPGTNFIQWYATSTTTWSSAITAEELLVCENIPDPSPNPCDLWVRYIGDAAPASGNGFSAGTAAYSTAGNSTAWVGRGFRDSWLIPGRVQITGTTGAIWVTYAAEYQENGKSAGEYLVLRDGCSCSWLEPQLASNHAGLVRTAEQYSDIYGSYDYAISRITYTDTRVSIAKVRGPFFKTIYTNPTSHAEVTFEPARNVLVCESQQDMSTQPTLSFGNKACGLWSRYRGNNWPATNGFLAGLDRFGNNAYVGRGENADIQWIGRVQLTGTKGVYLTSAGNEDLANVPEYLVVPNGCNCVWEPIATAKTKVGLVRSIDYLNAYAVGLKTLVSGKIAITSVDTDITTSNQFYHNDAGTRVTDTATVLLVCETA